MSRYSSIDILRALAIVLMIQVHFVDNLSPREESSAWLYDLSMWLGSWPAAFFAFLSGLSYALWLHKQQQADVPEATLTRITFKRGLFLFVLGLLFNAAVWLPEEVFNWDILTLLGTAFMLLAFARQLPLPVLGLLSGLLVLLSPLIRTVGDYDAYWEEGNYVYDFVLRDVLFGYVSNGYFPLFPWLVFPLAGYIVGTLLMQDEPPRGRWWRWSGFAVALWGIAMLLVLIADRLPARWMQHDEPDITEFPASTAFVAGLLGYCLLSFILLHLAIDRRRQGVQFGRLLSTFSLTIYVVHHAVMLWPLWLYGAWHGYDDVTIYYRNAMSTPSALGLAILFTVLSLLFLNWLERHPRWSLEWLLRRFAEGRPTG